jgi:DNA (cytosine-5)-methyltransferase 1
MSLIYGSVCSGIEAASVAWESLGWKPSFFSEIEAFPRAVLQHHYPKVSLHGDFTTINQGQYEPINLLVGGTPCQSFSVAGLRKGLDDDRGNLSLEFIRLAQRLSPKWLVWENVPGVLSIDEGRAFASFLGGLAECGYGFAYRVLDAQHFGVPQRRRRVFVVGFLGDWRLAAAVLFERESLCGDITPSKAETGCIAVFSGAGFSGYSEGIGTLRASEGSLPLTIQNSKLRKLTPREHERLQGFPDDYTLIPYRGKPAADAPRYKAIGNSMAVPVMRWIGERINLID